MNDAFAAALAYDLTRLAARAYGEVGVPMLLLAEDVSGAGDPGLAAALAAASDAATAQLVEMLADRHLLGPDGPVFTRLSDDEARG